MCFGYISKDFTANNMKNTRWNGYVSDFSVDYNSADVDHIVNVHKNLMKKHDIK